MRCVLALALLMSCAVPGDPGTLRLDAAAVGAGDETTEPTAPPTTGGAAITRLTHREWENTVVDLLALDTATGLSNTFLGDGLSAGFDNDAENLDVGPELWQDYQRAAETLAGELHSDPARLADLTGMVPTVDERYEAEGPEAVATTGDTQGGSYNLWSNGDLSVQVEVAVPGSYTVSTRLWATQAGPDLASASLSVDGAAAIGTFDVAATTQDSAEVFSATTTLTAGSHTLTVSFLNDYWEPEAGQDRNLLVDWLGLQGGSPFEAQDWVADFGSRAFRRPLTPDELVLYLDLFDRGPEVVRSGDETADGIMLVVSALLQAPQFVYRIETGDSSGALTSWEMASKLSYALWDTMPDQTLWDAAAADALTTESEVRDAATRLIDDPRFDAVLDDFHRQLLGLDATENIYKSDEVFPEWSEELNGAMRAESLAFTREVMRSGQGVHTLYTAPWTIASPELAALYGAAPPSGAMGRIELDPTQRAGILTQLAFLATNADPWQPSSIHRGVFIDMKLLCMDIPAPPDDVPPLPPLQEGSTNRDRIEAHTGEGTCGEGCHATVINPPGFAFENYDALGVYRTRDNGEPVDATGTLAFADGERTWQDGIDFAAALADSPDAHACYMHHWLSFTFARASHLGDATLSGSLGESSRLDDRPIRGLLLDLVSSAPFRSRGEF
jgi:hypothetical protein